MTEGTSSTGRLFESSHPKVSCFRKKAYDADRAKRIAARITRDNEMAGDLTVVKSYACTHCGWYHVGRDHRV